MGFRSIIFFIFGLAAVEAVAGERTPPADGLKPAGEGTVVAVTDARTFTLDDGREVRLLGVRGQPLGAGREALAALVAGVAVTLWRDKARVDRHGRLLAQVTLADGRWLQAELVRAGLASVQAPRRNHVGLDLLSVLERAARAAGRGIWADLTTREAATITPQTEGQYIFIEGEVLNAARTRNAIYLNFGTYWMEDATIRIDRRDFKAFGEDWQDPQWITGRRVRARGWQRQENGPMLDVSHPAMIEVLD